MTGRWAGNWNPLDGPTNDPQLGPTHPVIASVAASELSPRGTSVGGPADVTLHASLLALLGNNALIAMGC